MNLAAEAARLRGGEPQVSFVARGRSMTPRITDGTRVTVAPGSPRKGDVALARVRGRWYLHLVTAIRGGQVLIANNKGRVNGWTSLANVAGVLKEEA